MNHQFSLLDRIGSTDPTLYFCCVRWNSHRIFKANSAGLAECQQILFQGILRFDVVEMWPESDWECGADRIWLSKLISKAAAIQQCPTVIGNFLNLNFVITLFLQQKIWTLIDLLHLVLLNVVNAKAPQAFESLPVACAFEILCKPFQSIN